MWHQRLLSWTPLTWFSNLSWHYLHEHPAHVTPTSLAFPTGNVDSYTVTNIPSNKVSNSNEWEVRHLQTLRENKMHQCVQQVTLRLQLSVKQFVLAVLFTDFAGQKNYCRWGSRENENLFLFYIRDFVKSTPNMNSQSIYDSWLDITITSTAMLCTFFSKYCSTSLKLSHYKFPNFRNSK